VLLPGVKPRSNSLSLVTIFNIIVFKVYSLVKKYKVFWEELIAYFSLLETERTENDISNNSSFPR
jgi:hypothetical protein